MFRKDGETEKTKTFDELKECKNLDEILSQLGKVDLERIPNGYPRKTMTLKEEIFKKGESYHKKTQFIAPYKSKINFGEDEFGFDRNNIYEIKELVEKIKSNGNGTYNSIFEDKPRDVFTNKKRRVIMKGNLELVSFRDDYCTEKDCKDYKKECANKKMNEVTLSPQILSLLYGTKSYICEIEYDCVQSDFSKSMGHLYFDEDSMEDVKIIFPKKNKIQ